MKVFNKKLKLRIANNFFVVRIYNLKFYYFKVHDNQLGNIFSRPALAWI